MPITITGTGAKRSFVFTVSADTQKISNLADDAARYLFGIGYGTKALFDDMTNGEKLAMVDRYLKDALLTAAKSYNINSMVESARDTAIVDSGTKYALD
jgi:hypothetical protein